MIFLSVPESLRGTAAPGFSIDPDIPLPVEVPEEGIAAARAAVEDLSWEMIVAGMLKVLREGTAAADWLEYYRRFVVAVRPAILGELCGASAVKAANGDFDLAAEIADYLCALFPALPEVALNRAAVLERRAASLELRGSPDAACAGTAAADAYLTAMSSRPPLPDAFYSAGFFFLASGEYERARECLSRYAEVADEDGGDSEKLSRALRAVREIDAGGLEDEDFREACRLVRGGNEEAAMPVVRRFIESRPEVWNGWFVLGWALRRLCRWRDAAAALAKAVELGGTNADTRNELAICLMETGDLAGARRQLEAALRADGDNVKIMSNLGVLAMKSGDKAASDAFFRAAAELGNPSPGGEGG